MRTLNTVEEVRQALKDANAVYVIVRLGEDIIHVRSTKAAIREAIRGWKGELTGPSGITTASYDEVDDELLIG